MSDSKSNTGHLYHEGFTLIELILVFAIIAILSSIVLGGLNVAKEKAKISRAQSDLKQLQVAIELLYNDTGFHPNKIALFPCIQNPEIYLDSSAAGIGSTDGGFPGWKGPYMSSIPLDPWSTNYYFDPDYSCGAGTMGCDGRSGNVRVIQSFGPNKVQNYGNGDDIVVVLCRL